MAINPAALSSTPVTLQALPIVLEMLSSQPVLGQVISPARPPGQLCGYYNGSTDLVELYVVNNAGLRFYRIG